MNEGNDVYSELRDLQRRVESLETSVRVPGISANASTRGMQFEQVDMTFSNIWTTGSWTGFNSAISTYMDGPSVQVQPTASRRFAVDFGCGIQVFTASGPSNDVEVGRMSVRVVDPDGDIVMDYGNYEITQQVVDVANAQIGSYGANSFVLQAGASGEGLYTFSGAFYSSNYSARGASSVQIAFPWLRVTPL